MDSPPTYDAFLVTATGPFEVLQSWVGSHHGFVYSVTVQRDPYFQRPGNDYVMVFPKYEELLMPSEESGIRITGMSPVGPP